MTQTFNKELIFERIRDTGFPFWSLGLMQGFKNVINVMQYYGNDFEDSDNQETKIEKSIKRLDNIVSTFPENSVFVIEIKNAKQTNSNGIIGPFQFVNKLPQMENAAAPTLGAIPAGYVPESMLQGVEDRIKTEFDAKLQAYKAETEQRRRDDELKRRIEELDKREKELADLKKGYDSAVAKTSDTIVESLKKIIAFFLDAKPAAPTAPVAAKAQLGEVQQDAKSKKLDELAEYLYDNYDDSAITKLFENLKKTKQNAQSNMEQAQTATA